MAKKILKATFGSEKNPLIIGNISIPCFVLEDGKRVITQNGLLKALGIKVGSVEKFKKFGGAARLAYFLNKYDMDSFGSKGLGVLLKPIYFTVNNDKILHYGYEAIVLQEIVRVISKAYLKGQLSKFHQKIGENAEILYDAFAKVGIIALVDEATGYQDSRDKDALKKFLEKFLEQGQGKWVKTFPDDFFEMIFRIKKWNWRKANNGKNKPQVVGHYINDLVYSRIAPQILNELRRKNPKNEKGNRKGTHTQWLTTDYGHPKLKEHLSILIALAKAADFNEPAFKKSVNKALPKFNIDGTSTLELPFK
jgi:hypothetical protein